MDRRRRRFVPSSEGLEGRQMLSTATGPTVSPAATSTVVNPYGTAPAGTQVDGGSPVAQTIESKFKRIQNLPFFLGLLNRDGAVAQPAVQNIQADLDKIVGTLHAGNSRAVATFNHDLRRTLQYENIRQGDAEALNSDFGAVLRNAGVSDAIASDLQVQMNEVVKFDTHQRNPAIVAANDYATVLQVALGSGRPLISPAAPNLLGADHNGNVGKIAVTHNSRPTLTGNYAVGANIQIVDAYNQKVLGVGTVNATTGVYTAKFTDKLSDGVYTVHVRAEDSGFFSDASPKFTFKVITPPSKVQVTAATPGGPLKTV